MTLSKAHRHKVIDNYSQQDERLQDFKDFMAAVWSELGLPVPTPVQHDIADYLQFGPDRKQIQGFRGVAKSWITSAYVVWLLYWHPNHRILVVSASKDRSNQFSTFTKKLIEELYFLQYLKPLPNQRDANIAFDVGPSKPDHAPSIKSTGVMGQLTGSRANEIIADDIEVPNNSETQTMRLKLSERVKEFDSIILPGGRITYLGTPQSEQSVYTELRKRGFEVMVVPARFPDREQMDDYGHNPSHIPVLCPCVLAAQEKYGADKIAGLPTEDTRFPQSDLNLREASLGRRVFDQQFMLNTALSDAQRFPLKLRDLVIMDIDKELAPARVSWTQDPKHKIEELKNVGFGKDCFQRPLFVSDKFYPFTQIILSIDPSGRGEDKTAWVVLAILNGRMFLLAQGAAPGGYETESLEALAQTAKKYQAKTILIESNFGDGMFSALLKPVLKRIFPAKIEEVKVHTQKELRILDALEPLMVAHKLIVDQTVVSDDALHREEHQLFYQMTHLTRVKDCLLHDDALDALAQAVSHLREQMRVDEEKGEKELETRNLEAQIKRFVDMVKRSPFPNSAKPKKPNPLHFKTLR